MAKLGGEPFKMPIDSTMPGIERFFTIVGIRDAMGANTQYNTNKLRTKPLDLSRKWVVARLMTFETNTFFWKLRVWCVLP